MLLVRHVMATEPKKARWDMNAYDAAGLMAHNDIGSADIFVSPATSGVRGGPDIGTPERVRGGSEGGAR